MARYTPLGLSHPPAENSCPGRCMWRLIPGGGCPSTSRPPLTGHTGRDRPPACPPLPLLLPRWTSKSSSFHFIFSSVSLCDQRRRSPNPCPCGLRATKRTLTKAPAGRGVWHCLQPDGVAGSSRKPSVRRPGCGGREPSTAHGRRLETEAKGPPGNRSYKPQELLLGSPRHTASPGDLPLSPRLPQNLSQTPSFR